MEITPLSETLLAGLLTFTGLAIGKMWGAAGKRSCADCDILREGCTGKLEIKLDGIIERLERIERHVNGHSRA